MIFRPFNPNKFLPHPSLKLQPQLRACCPYLNTISDRSIELVCVNVSSRSEPSSSLLSMVKSRFTNSISQLPNSLLVDSIARARRKCDGGLKVPPQWPGLRARRSRGRRGARRSTAASARSPRGGRPSCG